MPVSSQREEGEQSRRRVGGGRASCSLLPATLQSGLALVVEEAAVNGESAKTVHGSMVAAEREKRSGPDCRSAVRSASVEALPNWQRADSEVRQQRLGDEAAPHVRLPVWC